MSENSNLIHVNSGLLSALNSGALSINVFDKEILVLKSIIAGTSFRDLSGIHDKLTTEVKLTLKREADNKHDELAVAVLFNDIKIGYVPREKNEVIARLMDGGKQFFAKITSKEWQGDWLCIEIDVFMND